MKVRILTVVLLFLLGSLTMSGNMDDLHINDKMNKEKELEVATLGAGCFWCTEAVFERLEGVEKVISGYSGGRVKNPSYREVTSGRTGHAEVCQVWFDPSVISYEELLDVFWNTHDPTTLNRQGNDVGTQYRSAIFYHNMQQKEAAIHSMSKMDASGLFRDPIVTEISEFDAFYEAEDYHQEYFQRNPYQGYCRAVIAPKVAKFRQKYAHRLKG